MRAKEAVRSEKSLALGREVSRGVAKTRGQCPEQGTKVSATWPKALLSPADPGGSNEDLQLLQCQREELCGTRLCGGEAFTAHICEELSRSDAWRAKLDFHPWTLRLFHHPCACPHPVLAQVQPVF